MTQDELAAIRARADAATPGPWRTHRKTGNLSKAERQRLFVWQDGSATRFAGAVAEVADGIHPDSMRDAAFIAAAREDVSTLLDEVERLRVENERLRAALEAVEYADMESRCPWCGNWRNEGHAPNCQRQAALGR